jgi:hypothetical protein
MNVKASRGLGGLVLGLLLGVATVGCTSTQNSEAQQAPSTVTLPGTTVVVTPAQAANQGSGNNGTSKAPPKTTAHTTSGTTPPATTTPPTDPAPKIVSFTVVQKPVCPVNGTPDAPFSQPGKPVVISWKITGADGAAISVDDPTNYGAYGSTYPATGQLELSFPCSNKAGQTTHKYTVWPKGYKTISQTLTVSAQNNA